MLGISDRQLQFGYWWVLHKKQLKTLRGIIILVVALLIFSNMTLQLIGYIQGRMTVTKNINILSSENIQYTQARQKTKPINVVLGEVQVIPSSTPKAVDVIVQITNPNESWAIAQLDYNFTVKGEDLSQKTTYLAPGQTIYLMDFGISSTSDSPDDTEAAIHMNGITWKQAHKGLLPEAVFTIGDFDFETTRVENPSVKNSIFTNIKTTITNESVYGFWKVDFLLLLTQDDEIIAAQKFSVDRFLMNETYTLQAQWNKQLSRSIVPKVIPIVNLVDESNLITIGE